MPYFFGLWEPPRLRKVEDRASTNPNDRSRLVYVNHFHNLSFLCAKCTFEFPKKPGNASRAPPGASRTNRPETRSIQTDLQQASKSSAAGNSPTGEVRHPPGRWTREMKPRTYEVQLVVGGQPRECDPRPPTAVGRGILLRASGLVQPTPVQGHRRKVVLDVPADAPPAAIEAEHT